MKLPLTLEKAESLILEACKSGQFEEDFYFGDWPHVSAKLLSDREALLKFMKLLEPKISKLHPRSPLRIAYVQALEETRDGWPTE